MSKNILPKKEDLLREFRLFQMDEQIQAINEQINKAYEYAIPIKYIKMKDTLLMPIYSNDLYNFVEDRKQEIRFIIETRYPLILKHSKLLEFEAVK